MSHCDHRPVRVGRIDIAACPSCAVVEWSSISGPVDPAEGMAALFGNYEMIGQLDALGAPAHRVIAYRPPSSRRRAHLDAFPKNVWLHAGPDLWLSHDGATLLLAPTRQIVFENLTRRQAQ